MFPAPDLPQHWTEGRTILEVQCRLDALRDHPQGLSQRRQPFVVVGFAEVLAAKQERWPQAHPAMTVGRAAEKGIVRHHRSSVQAEPDIELDEIGAVFGSFQD
jgi:hypothetical protein